MKLLLVIVTSLITSLAFSQLPDNLLELREKKVSKMHVSSSDEFWSFAYHDNEVITNYVRSNSFILVHKSFYNEAKRPDSIIVLEITKLDSAYQYVSIDYFQYEFDDLKKLKSETLFSDDRIYKELFFFFDLHLLPEFYKYPVSFVFYEKLYEKFFSFFVLFSHI